MKVDFNVPVCAEGVAGRVPRHRLVVGHVVETVDVPVFDKSDVSILLRFPNEEGSDEHAPEEIYREIDGAVYRDVSHPSFIEPWVGAFSRFFGVGVEGFPEYRVPLHEYAYTFFPFDSVHRKVTNKIRTWRQGGNTEIFPADSVSDKGNGTRNLSELSVKELDMHEIGACLSTFRKEASTLAILAGKRHMACLMPHIVMKRLGVAQALLDLEFTPLGGPQLYSSPENDDLPFARFAIDQLEEAILFAGSLRMQVVESKSLSGLKTFGHFPSPGFDPYAHNLCLSAARLLSNVNDFQTFSKAGKRELKYLLRLMTPSTLELYQEMAEICESLDPCAHADRLEDLHRRVMDLPSEEALLFLPKAWDVNLARTALDAWTNRPLSIITGALPRP